MVRLCRARLLLWMSLVGCGGTHAPEQHIVPSTTSPVIDSGAISAASGGAKVSMPESGTNASTDAMPGRDPADVDSGRAPPRPTDAGGDRTLDAGMPSQAGSDASEAGKPMPGAEDAAVGEPTSVPRLPPVTSVTMDGPFTTTVDASTGPGRAAWVVRPTMLGADGLKHPIFIWGPGRGTQVRDYETLMRRIASHGFVVYSELSRAADGTEMVAAMTWLMNENERSGSPYYQKLDGSKIGVGGHSFGSNSAMTASSDPRVKAFIHTAGSGFRGAGKALNLRQPAAFICGEDDPTATSPIVGPTTCKPAPLCSSPSLLAKITSARLALDCRWSWPGCGGTSATKSIGRRCSSVRTATSARVFTRRKVRTGSNYGVLPAIPTLEACRFRTRAERVLG